MIRMIHQSQSRILRIIFEIAVICQHVLQTQALIRPLKCKNPPIVCITFNKDPAPAPYTSPPEFTDSTFWKPHTIVADEVDIPPRERGAFTTNALKLFRYFERADISGVHESYDGTDFQIIEWPGQATAIPSHDTQTINAQLDFQHLLFSFDRVRSVPLSFEGGVSKFLSYPCNLFEGVDNRALGYKRNPNATTDTDAFFNPFYLSIGVRSLHKDYIQPLFVPLLILNEMVEDHEDPECQPISDTPFIHGNKTKINHVLDFAFTNGRLIIGMHCGILVATNIDLNKIVFKIAKLDPQPTPTPGDGFPKDSFDYLVRPSDSTRQQFLKIDLIVSTTCCPQSVSCDPANPLAVAYSYNQNSLGEEIKFVYLSTNYGDSFTRKVVATSSPFTVLNLIRTMYEDVKELEPIWVSEEIGRLKAKPKKNDEEWVAYDPVVQYIMQRKTLSQSKINTTRESCVEIVGIAIVGEENSFVGLCRMTDSRDGTATDSIIPPASSGPGERLTRTYGVFNFRIVHSSPIITPIRKTKRRLACSLTKAQLGDGTYNYYEPDLIRAPFSFNIFVVGCHSVVYHSVNGGHTFWNLVWYMKGTNNEFLRHQQNPDIEYPLVAFSPNGETMSFGFGDKYAFGLINYNREFRLIVGVIAPTTGVITEPGIQDATGAGCFNPSLVYPNCTELKPECIAAEKDKPENKMFNITHTCFHYWITIIPFSSPTKFVPFFSSSGQPFFSMNIMGTLKADEGNQHFTNYKNHFAARLLDLPIEISRNFMPLFLENTLLPKALAGRYGFRRCSTYSFSLEPDKISLDIGESGTIRVGVEDTTRFLPLGIFSSQSSLLKIDVSLSNRSIGAKYEVRKHEWDVSITALGQLKPRLNMLSDAHFGGDYSTYVEVATHVVLTSLPQARCHVQPSGSVYTELSCGNKILVAHEDYYRPHCPTFFDNYVIELKKGAYDEDMVKYWLKQAPQYYSTSGDNVKVIYPYELFECPILPYRLDPYEPDLRVIDLRIMPNVTNTEIGIPYNRSYVLIEIHGRKGYSYSQTVREAGCVRPPQTLKQMVTEWRTRLSVTQSAFRKYPHFDVKSVEEPENIWNHVNYRRCDEPGDYVGKLTEEDLDQKYEIMRRGSGNTLVFDSADHEDVYVFLAVEVDPAPGGSFCEYKRYFAVNIQGNMESDDLTSFLRFLGFFILTFLVILICFCTFRVRVRRQFRETALVQRLEKGAWEMLYRYEKLLRDLNLGREDKLDSLEEETKSKKKRHSIPKLKIRSKAARQSIAGFDTHTLRKLTASASVQQK